MAYVNPKWNRRSGSHTWSSKPDKMRSGGAAGRAGASKTPPFRGISRRDWAEPLTIQVRYRGGAEAWWLVEARGRRQAFPGHLSLHDVMAVVTGQYDSKAD